MDPRLRPLVITLAMTALGTYLAGFFSHVAAFVWPTTGIPRLGAGEGFDHIWTSVSVLIGSIVAIALGQPIEPRRAGGWWEERLIVFYAWGWFAVGVVATLVWAIGADSQVPLLIKNAATAFVGLVIPVMSSFFRNGTRKRQREDETGADNGDGGGSLACEDCRIFAHTVTTSLDVAELDLAEHAKAAAVALKKKYPSVVFTSGRRTVSEQASAMAGNIIRNRKWIEQTYAASSERNTLQKWVDDHPGATTRTAIAQGLETIMTGWTVNQLLKLSRHFNGLAFDIQPATQEIKDYIKSLPHYVKFLDNEGGITIWHTEFAAE